MVTFIEHLCLLEQGGDFFVYLLEFVPQGMGDAHFPGRLHGKWFEFPRSAQRNIT